MTEAKQNGRLGQDSCSVAITGRLKKFKL